MSQNASPFLTIINNSGIQFSFYELLTCVRVNWPGGEGQTPNKYFLQFSREKILAKIEKREYPQLARGQVTLAPLPESAGKISSLICRDIKENERDKLLGIFRKFYNTLQTHKQKVAYLCYLLHYQHYNAEYTEEECKRLGYPFPLSALQRQPGYFRFEHERLMKLMEPWLRKNVSVLNRQRDVKPFSLLTPTTNLAIAVFKQFFTILTVDEFRDPKQVPAETVGVILPVSRKDLSEKRGDQIIEQYVGKLTDMQKKRVFFLFGLKPQPIDCILTWIGEWRVCSGRLWFDYFSLDARFGNNIFSLLKECGAVPDRISVNQFVTYGLDKASFDEAFNQCLRTQNSLRPNPWRVGAYTSSSNNWEKIMEGIALFNFKEEQGCEIFRDAILKWSNLLFSDSTLFNAAAPLLSAEVCPWLQKNGDLVSWSKGYQNLVEIVMFLIQAFPEKFQGYSFERDLLQKLPETKHRAVGLFSYGMTGFYEVMNIILMRYRAQSPNVACISQSYFEMLMLLREMQRTRKIGVNEYASLDKIQKLPNVLVADIHPNNAARKQLFQNNVGGWVKEQLDRENGRTLCLVLDITLNHLSDPIIEQTFKDLLPYIEAGRLHLFGIQSLAKLVQLGADNFSGGATFYLGNDDTIKFSPPIREKSAFFALMNKEFQEHIDRYLNLVRENTEYLYLTLNRLTLDIEKRIKIKRNDQEGEVSFCAAQITTNVDSQTVYVALHFRNLLNEWGVHENDDNQVKTLVKQLKKILIQAADVRGLPLTERQSFGFSLMSVSDVKDAIRISVGMEGKTLLNEYAELIYDFNYCLSKYIAQFENGRGLNAFEETFLRANKIAEGKELYFGERIDIFEEVCDENGRDIFDKRGGAQVVFTNGNIELKCYDNEGALYSVIKDPRMIRVGSRMMSIGQIESVKVPLLFHLCMVGTRQLTVFMEYTTSYLVDGFFEDILEWSFLERGDIRDPSSGVVLKINPSLSMVYQDIKYKEDKIYIIDSHFGGNPARWDKLDAGMKNKKLQEMSIHDLGVVEGPLAGTKILKAKAPKKQIDYIESVTKAWNLDFLNEVVKLTNTLEKEGFPLPHDHHWRFPKSPEGAFLDALEWLGYRALFSLLRLKQDIEQFGEKYQKAILTGIATRLLDDSLCDSKSIKPYIAEEYRDLLANYRGLSFLPPQKIELWLMKLIKYLHEFPDGVERVKPYLTIFVPEMKHLYKSLWSFDEQETKFMVKKIAQKLNIPVLNEFMQSLEDRTIVNASISHSPEALTFYLELYVRYPFSDEQKSMLIQKVKGCSNKQREAWLISPKFYFDPLDHFEYGMCGCPPDIIFYENERASIRDFFEQIECFPVLQQLEDRQVDAFERWKMIINH